MAEYPFIIHCADCNKYSVPIPLSDYPIAVEDFTARPLTGDGCKHCGSTELMLSQSKEAEKFYDNKVRKQFHKG